ncbi:molybdenum cofactor guanylyltransferase [Pedobacter frigiditerrae]|uniref:Molybdenum cofactor guanylyltransferase n=1 Tax=Pedobacter frigiditerrae TaxID=2530452 RepID=A0A4R0MKX8_9SPHI|nr:molybdenum cofactor guanylyltransferase [Pedobacter frigiditerrae]TCC87281.1 molybdenum cofactor guanylyltransferase [Pedobacter frigiditerrae]
MIGLVLCGGQSERMGSDKGILLADGQTWASLAEEKLKALNLPIQFSVNANQESNYGNLFQKENLIPDDLTLNIGGPLKGVLSAHLSAPAEDLYVLACDLIKMDISLMNRLIDEKKQYPDFDAYVYLNNEFYEPLCGIYTANGLAKIMKLYNKGNLKKHSMHATLDLLNTYKINLSAAEQGYFKNFNSPSELNK